YAGFANLLTELNVPVSYHRLRDIETMPPDALVILPVANWFGSDLVARATAIGHGRRLLVILPRWRMQDVAFNGWAEAVGEFPPGVIDYLLQQFAPPESMVQQAPDTASPTGIGFVSRSSLSGPNDCLNDAPLIAAVSPNLPTQLIDTKRSRLLEPVVQCRETSLLAKVKPHDALAITDDQIFILSDPALLANLRLGDREALAAAALMVEQLREGYRPVVFDETLVGPLLDPNLWSYAFRPPVVALSLALLLLLVCAIWRSVPRFGAALPTPAGLPTSKHALIWNAADMLVVKGAYRALARDYRRALATAVKGRASTEAGADAADIAWLGRLAESRGLEAEWAQINQRLEDQPNRPQNQHQHDQQMSPQKSARRQAKTWLPVVYQLYDLVKRLRV
ncbi:MAG: hypothetical protein AAF556_00730, partial [Pseudomonadota bacterium]